MHKILVIEDNQEIRENIAEILELSNYDVSTAANGKIGVEKALEILPDLIVCDIMMPVLDGYGVLHAIHKNEQIKNTPFIFLTAKSERIDFRKGMELGADDYITKPFDSTELLNAIDSRIKKSELIKSDFVGGIRGLQSLVSISSGKSQLNELIINSDSNSYKKKQTIYSEGNHPRVLYYIQKGKVKIVKINNDGKELIIDLFKEGDFFGEIALIQNSVYKESAVTMDDCELVLIQKDEFENLLNSSKEVSHFFLKLLSNNISTREHQLLNLAYNSLRKKVADTIILIQNKYKDENSENFKIDISRDNLASLAGTATESLIRTLSDFKSEKLIEIEGGCIKILNEHKLKNILN